MRILVPVSLLLVAVALPAQGVISPAHFTSLDANTYSRYCNPFGYNQNNYRCLQVHDDLAGRTLTIKGLALRRDGGQTSSYKGYTVYADLFLSTAVTTAAKPDTTFDKNHGADKKGVLTFGKIDFPKTQPGIPPRPFEYKVPFATPFSFGGKGPLCWEVKIQANQNTSTVYLDSCSGSDSNPRALLMTIGQGCKRDGSNYRFTAASTSASFNWPAKTGSVTLYCSYGPKSSLVFFFLGLSKTNFGGLPLPFELPTTKSGSSGACNLYTDILLLFPMFTDGNGYASQKVPFTGLTMDFHGATLYCQAMGPDPKANGLGVITSDARAIQFMGPYKAVPVGGVDSPGNVYATTGTVRANYGYVVRFD